MRGFRANYNTITYNYLSYRLKIDDNSKDIKIPLVPILLKHLDNETEATGLIDSGSTNTFLPSDFGEILQLKPLTGKEAVPGRGAGGVFHTYSARLDQLSILKGREVIQEYGKIEVNVLIENGSIPYVILGRDYLSRTFDIRFDENKNNVVLRRYFSTKA
ncbi:MAG: retropepsin-like domain-containing protein [Nitrososphaerota archaeon]|nr:retropepsin-like domain-containing protein [Nitrososphaerota archaeon]